MENHRESVHPSGRAAQNRMGERRRKTRQNADRLRRPAREQEPWRSSAGRPPRGTKKKNQQKNPPPGRAGPGPGLLREARSWPFVRPVVLFGYRQKAGVGVSSGAGCGRGGSYFFHSASLRKKNTGLSAPLGKTRASPGPPWPVLSRVLRRRRLISVTYQTQPLPRPVLGLHPAGAGRGRLYIMPSLCKPAPTPTPTPPRFARPTVPGLCGVINV
jgi:hypothetical protein